ncbi:MAG: hypothetical protein JKX85_10455 [Phycisphaeraceae bacterium]|nr:hypothetical protein [Phycisphaeraceae bacterium]
MAKGAIKTIHISDEAKELVDLMNDRFGIDRKLIVDRALFWLGNQPEEVQAAILMSVSQSMQADFAQFALQRLTDQQATQQATVTPEQPGGKLKYAGKPKAQYHGTPRNPKK